MYLSTTYILISNESASVHTILLTNRNVNRATAHNVNMAASTVS